jgi:hypothetical protein
MWVPPVTGARASATASTGDGVAAGMSFKILGIGGGPTVEETFTLELARKDI